MASPQAGKSETDSYRTIFKSSSLLGGSQGICYFFSIIRTKALAHYLGPVGVGALGTYSLIGNTIGALSGLGIGESAIREVAAAYGTGDPQKIERAVTLIRRVSLLTGFLGLLLSIIFAIPLSVFCYGTAEHSLDIGLLGLTLLAGAIASGEMALLQGSRSYVKIANMNVLSTSLGVVPAILIYAIWREAAVVPSLLMFSAISLAVTLYFSRTLEIKTSAITWEETIAATRPMLVLGVSFMFSGLLSSGKDVVIRSVITNSYGLDSTGIYQSAWALSGLFVNFILNAMGMDFYPRLTAMLEDRPAMAMAVNHQIEIGILLALPGVLATITCAPMVLYVLYSSKFLSASGLLAVLACGVLFKIVSYPLNTIQLAMGDARGFIVYGGAFAVLETALSVPLILAYGPMGAAVAYFMSCLGHVFAMAWVGHKLIDYRIDRECVLLLIAGLLQISVGLLIAFLLHGFVALSFGAGLVIISGIFSMRGLAKRLGREHRFVRLFLRVPFGHLIIPDFGPGHHKPN